MAAGQAQVSVPPVRVAGQGGAPDNSTQGQVGAVQFDGMTQEQLNEASRKRRMTATGGIK